MNKPAFHEIETWVFDLDHTLYPPSVNLFAQIEVKMTDWVMRVAGVDRPRADHLRQHYWEKYGTTLAGLMQEHQADPGPYLHDVHDIDFSALSPDPHLAHLIDTLPGRKIVYTNGCVPYAKNVLQGRGLSGAFDAIYGVEDADFLPKPRADAFDLVFAKDGLTPARAIMFEDDPRNLVVPDRLGMRTVLVADHEMTAGHIDHHTADLTAFLAHHNVGAT